MTPFFLLCAFFSFVIGVVALFPMMMSPMLADAPGSERKPLLRVLVACLIALPFTLMLGSAASLWRAHFAGVAAGWTTYGEMAMCVGAIVTLIAFCFIFLGFKKR